MHDFAHQTCQFYMQINKKELKIPNFILIILQFYEIVVTL